jgi:hypothetical protein
LRLDDNFSIGLIEPLAAESVNFSLIDRPELLEPPMHLATSRRIVESEGKVAAN